MKILITGATGFIGRHLVKHFVDLGYEVVGTYRKENVEKIEGCKYIKIDLSRECLEEQMVDCVIHCAGQVQNGLMEEYLDNSVNATRKLIKYCESTKVKKIVFMSSIAVYGECKDEVNEDSDRINLNDYAIAKTICEKIILQSNIPFRYIVRLSRIVGEGGFETGGFITMFARQLIYNEEVNYSNGDLLYNNIFYIDDLKNVIKKLVDETQIKDILIGVGAEKPITIGQMIRIMQHSIGSKSKLTENIHEGRLTCHLINIDKMKKWGYEPFTVEETLKLVMKDALVRFGGK